MGLASWKKKRTRGHKIETVMMIWRELRGFGKVGFWEFEWGEKVGECALGDSVKQPFEWKR